MATKKNPYVKAAIIIGSIGLATGAFFVIRRQIQRAKDRRDNPSTEETESKGLSDIIFGNTPTSCRFCNQSASFPLQKGSKGKQVAAVQYAYNLRFPSSKISVDGDWGTKTESAFTRLAALYPSQNFSQATGREAGTANIGSTSRVAIGPKTYASYFKQFETI